MRKMQGGRDEIIRIQNDIRRPSGQWSKYVAKFLVFLHENGFDKAPKFIRFMDNGDELVSYVEGNVENELSYDLMKSDKVLISAAKLLREYHDVSSQYIQLLTGDETWMLAVKDPVEVMCHGDFAPYNTAMIGKKAVGIIDFDTLHPGNRLWDIAYALYRWVPMVDNKNTGCLNNPGYILKRIGVFMDAYRYKKISYGEIIECIIERLEYLVEFMISKAEDGDKQFIRNITDGHHIVYHNDIEDLRIFLSTVK